MLLILLAAAIHMTVASSLALHTPSPTTHLQQARTASPSSAPTSDLIETLISTNLITIPGETNSVVTNPGQTITIEIPTCSQTITPDANGYVPPGTCGALWNYYPSFGAAIVFAVVFAVLVMVHVWQAVVHRKVRECSPRFCQYRPWLPRMNQSVQQLYCPSSRGRLKSSSTDASTEVVLGHHHGLQLGDSGIALPDNKYETSAA